MQVRVLTAADGIVLDRFLTCHRDTSMFLRENARRGGLTYQGKPFQAVYVGGFDSGQMVGVAAHCWNGWLLVQTPDGAEKVARGCVEASGRAVTGFSGPPEHVRLARSSLGLENAPTRLSGDERLYALDLANLVLPPTPSGTVCRRPRDDERDTLREWRVAYDIETLGATDTPEMRQQSAEFLDAQIADGNVWVAVHDGVPVSLSAINASLPDIVQLGGIYTPPHLRGRGYAKAAVAATLACARERGASRAVLFTNNPSAVRTYEASGFRHVGEYSLVILE